MSEYKNRIMFLGKKLRDSDIKYHYVEVLNNNELGKKWVFSKQLFKKGSVGSIYDCNFDGSTIEYNKSCIPSNLIEKSPQKFESTFIAYPILDKHNEESNYVDLVIRNSKKQKSNIDYEIEAIRDTYRWLNPRQKSQFIADLVYKITKNS